MRRREFITLLGGAAAAWPLTARAQQGERTRRIGVIAGGAESDEEFQARFAAFRQALQQLGWLEGGNVRFDYRFGSIGNIDVARRNVAALLALAPDVILASGSQHVRALQEARRPVPIVFAGVIDPVGAGFVESLARPGGNATGLTSFEYGMSTKWLELLKQIAPSITRAAVLRDPSNPSGVGQMAAMQGVAPSLGMELSPIGLRDVGELERGIAAFVRGSTGGLIVTLAGFTIAHRDQINALAARHRLPAVYPARFFSSSGGLISYGANSIDPYRRAAEYVNRILKGEKPAADAARSRRRGDRVMRRREFITLLGGAAAAWPVAARAQQTVMPVIGFLHPASPERFADRVRGFRQGLKDTGYVEGENVAIEYRWADSQLDRLPALAAELVRRQVAVIAAPGGPLPGLAAKAATATIPIVFLVAEDPVRLGLVASLARPGGNLTGINFFNAELSAKRLELLRTLLPGAARVAVLVNPGNATTTETTLRDLESAGRAMGLQIQVLNASTSREIDAAFQVLVRERPDAIFVSLDTLFADRRVQLVHWTSRHAIPATYALRDFIEAGGLMSYGTNFFDAYRQVGLYTGRILKGAKPADLPVVQSSKFELVINHQTARILGLTVPPTLLSVADEVIE